MRQVAILPPDDYPEILDDKIFDSDGYAVMRDVMKEQGLEVHTYDRYEDVGAAEALVVLEIPYPDNCDYRSAIENFCGPKIAMVFECPVVKPFNHDLEEHKAYDYVITWDDSKVDNRKYHHFYWPQSCKPFYNETPFRQKKIAAMVVGNKATNQPHELYSERRRAIRFFQRRLKSNFDLYGRPRWDTHRGKPSILRTSRRGLKETAMVLKAMGRYPSYRGEMGSKLDVLPHYRFVICYENMKNINGYVTEKIWDCFACGTVPVYLGAENIADLIPESCFIDKRHFPSYDALLKRLVDMDEEEHERYLSNARDFLISERAQSWDCRQWGRDVGNLLTRMINS